MTFEEWFEENFPCGYTKDGSEDTLGMKKYLKQSWEAGRADGIDSMGGPVG